MLVAVSYLWNQSLPEVVKAKLRPQAPHAEESVSSDEGMSKEGERKQVPSILPAIKRLMSYESVLNPDAEAETKAEPEVDVQANTETKAETGAEAEAIAEPGVTRSGTGARSDLVSEGHLGGRHNCTCRFCSA